MFFCIFTKSHILDDRAYYFLHSMIERAAKNKKTRLHMDVFILEKYFVVDVEGW